MLYFYVKTSCHFRETLVWHKEQLEIPLLHSQWKICMFELSIGVIAIFGRHRKNCTKSDPRKVIVTSCSQLARTLLSSEDQPLAVKVTCYVASSATLLFIKEHVGLAKTILNLKALWLNLVDFSRATLLFATKYICPQFFATFSASTPFFFYCLDAWTNAVTADFATERRWVNTGKGRKARGPNVKTWSSSRTAEQPFKKVKSHHRKWTTVDEIR